MAHVPPAEEDLMVVVVIAIVAANAVPNFVEA